MVDTGDDTKLRIDNVAVIIFDKDRRQVFLVQEKRSGNPWSTPGGKVKRGETFWQAAKREYLEETGYPLPECWNLDGKRGFTKHFSARKKRTLIYIGILAGPEGCKAKETPETWKGRWIPRENVPRLRMMNYAKASLMNVLSFIPEVL